MKIFVFLIALLFLFLASSPVEAKKRTFCRAKGNILIHCTTARSKAHARQKLYDRRQSTTNGSSYSGDHEGRGALAEVPFITVPKHRQQAKKRPTIRVARGSAEGGRLLAGVVEPLAAKASQIVAACGASVISGVRRTLVAGTRRLSLHASGRAVDLKGNPGCIYAMLQGWPGGYSTDYGRVRHVHVSYAPGGAEWGLRFAHGGRKRQAARRRHWDS